MRLIGAIALLSLAGCAWNGPTLGLQFGYGPATFGFTISGGQVSKPSPTPAPDDKTIKPVTK